MTDEFEDRPPRRQRPELRHVVSVVIGVAGVVCALIIPFAPVWSNTTLVT